MQHWNSGKPIILQRSEFQKLFHHIRQHEPLRNQLIILFPSKMGLRTREMRTLQWRDINIADGRVTIQNSKSKHFYPIPLSLEIAEALEEYQRGHEGYVLRRLRGYSYSHLKAGKPITNVIIWKTWHKAARRAGLSNPRLYTPRLGRHYFAAKSTFHPNPNKRLNLETIRRILRHKNLAYTQVYLSRLVFFEDIQADYDRVHNLPIKQDVNKMYSLEMEESGRVELREECLTCPAQSVCKYKELLAQVPVAGPCRRRPQIVKLAQIESDISE